MKKILTAASAAALPFLLAPAAQAASGTAEPFTTCTGQAITWSVYAPETVPAATREQFRLRVNETLRQISDASDGRYAFAEVAQVILSNAGSGSDGLGSGLPPEEQEMLGVHGGALRASAYSDLVFLLAPNGERTYGSQPVITLTPGWTSHPNTKDVMVGEERVSLRGGILGEYNVGQWNNLKTTTRNGMLSTLTLYMLGIKDVEMYKKNQLNEAAKNAVSQAAQLSCELAAQRPGANSNLPAAPLSPSLLRVPFNFN